MKQCNKHFLFLDQKYFFLFNKFHPKVCQLVLSFVSQAFLQGKVGLRLKKTKQPKLSYNNFKSIKDDFFIIIW